MSTRTAAELRMGLKSGQTPAEIRKLHGRIETLEAELRERDNMLEAIQCGDIDALMVNRRADDYHLYTLQSVDHPYQVLIEHIGEGAFTIREDGTALYGNRRFAAMLGISVEEIIGQQMRIFLLPEDAEMFNQMLDEAKHVVTRNELTICAANGKKIPVNVSLNFLRRNEDVAVLCGILTDLSEQKGHLKEMKAANADLVRLAGDLERARDVAEQANRAKTRFLAGISHELRTPLHGILGYAQLLRLDEGLNAMHLSKVDAMMGAGTHLLHMINRVLDLSAIEAERVELEAGQIDLRSIAGGCLDLIRPAAAAKGLAVSLAMAPNVPTEMTTDPTRLRQVLFNLLGNAVKFTGEGSIELRLGLTTDGVCLRAEVADTGPGIPADQQHRLFQEFERLSADAVGPVEGAGLGLVLSARLTTLIGGRMGYEDNPGGGSVFWLEIPMVAAPLQAEKPVPNTQDEPSVAAAARMLHVLVVDDVAMNRDIASSFLRAGGHRAACAVGGPEAVAAIAAEDFDIVLMDVRMPGMDGLEATRRVRALEGPRSRVPIVALTAQAFSGQAQEYHEAGMDGYLVKPLTLASLLDTVMHVAAVGRPAEEGIRVVPKPVTMPDGPSLGLELPTLNSTVFDATAGFLTPETVASHMRTLVDQGEALRHRLAAPDTFVITDGGLVAAAHTLAGSASMFGFERLAAAGRDFEHAVQDGTAETPVLARSLSAALDSALEEMRSRMVVAKS